MPHRLSPGAHQLNRQRVQPRRIGRHLGEVPAAPDLSSSDNLLHLGLHPPESTIHRRIGILFRFSTGKGMKEADSYDNNIEQSAETVEPPRKFSRDDLSDVHEHANALLAALENVPDGDMVGEIVANALKLLRDNTNRG